jgi:hypothetical protein
MPHHNAKRIQINLPVFIDTIAFIFKVNGQFDFSILRLGAKRLDDSIQKLPNEDEFDLDLEFAL